MGLKHIDTHCNPVFLWSPKCLKNVLNEQQNDKYYVLLKTVTFSFQKKRKEAKWFMIGIKPFIFCIGMFEQTYSVT